MKSWPYKNVNVLLNEKWVPTLLFPRHSGSSSPYREIGGRLISEINPRELYKIIIDLIFVRKLFYIKRINCKCGFIVWMYNITIYCFSIIDLNILKSWFFVASIYLYLFRICIKYARLAFWTCVLMQATHVHGLYIICNFPSISWVILCVRVCFFLRFNKYNIYM